MLIEIIECQCKIPGQPGIALQRFRDALKIGWRDCSCGFSLTLLADLFEYPAGAAVLLSRSQTDLASVIHDASRRIRGGPVALAGAVDDAVEALKPPHPADEPVHAPNGADERDGLTAELVKSSRVQIEFVADGRLRDSHLPFSHLPGRLIKPDSLIESISDAVGML